MSPCSLWYNLISRHTTRPRRQLQQLFELHTAEALHRDIVYISEQRSAFLWRMVDTRVLFAVDYRIHAGLDLTEGLKVRRVPGAPQRLLVTLPRARVLSIDVDEESIHQYQLRARGRRLGWLEIAAELERVKDRVAEDATEHGLLERAVSVWRAVLMTHRSRRRQQPLRILVIVVLVLLAAALILGRPYLRRLQRTFAPIRRARVVGHDLLLQELYDLGRLHTLEYRYRTVFPFAYMPEGMSVASILGRLRHEDRRYEDAVSAEERDFLAAYDIVACHGIGTRRVGDFVVLDVIVSAGFTLEALGAPDGGCQARAGATGEEAAGNPAASAPAESLLRITAEAAPANGSEPLGGSETPEGNDALDGSEALQVATVFLPAPTVTQVRVVDIDPDAYPYPDIALSPAAYREIAAYVAERAERHAVQRGVLEQARVSAERLVEQLLRQAGVDRVEFTAAPRSAALYTPELH